MDADIVDTARYLRALRAFHWDRTPLMTFTHWDRTAE